MFDVIKTRWGIIGVGAVAATLVVVLAAQRDDAKAPRPAGARSAAPLAAAAESSPPEIDDSAPEPPELNEPMPTCQVFQGATLQAEPRFFPTNYLMLGDIDVLTQAPPLRWRQRSDNRIFELRGNLPVDLGVGAPPKYREVLWDDNDWYSEACFEFCDRRDSVGASMSQIRIDRRTGAMTRLSQGDPFVSARLLHQGFIYWASSNGCSIGEGVMRVATAGGRTQVLGLDGDYIRELRAYREGILVTAASTIGWIANESSTIFPIMTSEGHQHREARDNRNTRDHRFATAVFDGHGFYISERIGGQRDTTIFFVELATRKVRIVLDTEDTITQLAVHGDALYFTTQASADIFAVATRGGTPHIVVAEQQTEPCATVEGLWATDAGLVWTRGDHYARGTALYLAAWAELRAK